MQDLSQEAVDQKNSGKSRDRFRVFVIDDSALVRDGIRSLYLPVPPVKMCVVIGHPCTPRFSASLSQ